MDALTLHRIHFAFTITYHYLFPQLTMGLALLIVVLKTLALRTGDAHYDGQSAHTAHRASVVDDRHVTGPDVLLHRVLVIPRQGLAAGRGLWTLTSTSKTICV